MKTISTTILFFLTGFLSIHAQQTTYSQEDSTVTISELKRVYRYITRANVEEKTLLKIGIRPNSLSPFSEDDRNSHFGLNLEMVVEHKIHPSVSILVGIDYVPLYNSIKGYTSSPQAGSKRTLRFISHDVKARFGTRYYYAMSRRIRDGKTANNFSGNYVGLNVSRPVLYQFTRYDYDSQTGEPTASKHKTPLFRLDQPSLELNWGLQRRLWRLGYIDVSAGPRITFIGESSLPVNNEKYTTFSFQFNALIGLGW
ncbi:hypothetical protein [Larkinella rosea]|uniref:DUF3575 domain-containing protein n=1 Tax=Larkinella rosea TaxID=2025312 RepID=A0A3P1BCG7_9BACT|nr:hypothetical protein [Larkinella rosea]RRA98876.1 hypothetical protein EHT25_28220 [Larkinella rosea]